MVHAIYSSLGLPVATDPVPAQGQGAAGDEPEDAIDDEIGDDDEPGKSHWQVMLRPLVTGAKLLLLANADERWDVTVTVQTQDPVICGRNNEPRRTDTVEFRVRTATWYQFLCSAVHTDTASRLSSRQVQAGRAIQMWLQTLLKSFTA